PTSGSTCEGKRRSAEITSEESADRERDGAFVKSVRCFVLQRHRAHWRLWRQGRSDQRILQRDGRSRLVQRRPRAISRPVGKRCAGGGGSVPAPRQTRRADSGTGEEAMKLRVLSARCWVLG